MKSQDIYSKTDTSTERIESIFNSCHVVHLHSEFLEKSVHTAQKCNNVLRKVEQNEADENSTVRLLFLEHVRSGAHELRIQTEPFLESGVSSLPYSWSLLP